MNDGLVDAELPWSRVSKVELSKDKGWAGAHDIVLTHGQDKTKVEFDGKTAPQAIEGLARALQRARQGGSTPRTPGTIDATSSSKTRAALTAREEAFQILRERLILAGADERQKSLAHDAFSRAAGSLRPLPYNKIVEEALFEAYAARRDERKKQLQVASGQLHLRHCLCGCPPEQRRGGARA